MTNNLNQIEDNLYRLGVDAEGHVPEMVAELKEAYRKAKAFDECLELLEELKYTANPHDVMSVYDNVISVFRRHMESGDSND